MNASPSACGVTVTGNPPAGTVGTAYSTTFGASGGTTPYTYTLSSGSLPPGLTLNSSGVLSGTPTLNGTYTFFVLATDSTSTPKNGSSPFTITVSGLSLASTPSSLAQVNVTYNQTNVGSGGSGTYTYSVAGGTLPAGTSLNVSTGTVSGTPTTAGSFSYMIKVTDTISLSTVTNTISGTIAASSTLGITATASSAAQVSITYSQSNVASGGSGSYTYSVSAGTLPAGTSLNTSTGLVSGTPTAAGSFSYTIQITDGLGTQASVTTSGSIAAASVSLILNSTASSSTQVGAAYSQTNAGNGGVGVYTYSISAGSLPAGTTLNTSSGIVSGTPTTAGAFSYTILVTDSGSNTASNPISGTISAGSQTITYTSTAPSSATVGGATYTPTATATSGLTVALTIDAASSGVCTISGGIVSFIGAGTCIIDGNQAGNASYSAAAQVQQSFTVGQGSQTISYTSIAPSSATVGGATYTPSATATSGLTVAFTIDASSSSVCTISTGVVSFIGVGTCTINANQAGNASYNAATQVQQSFTVGQGSQTISFTSTAPTSTGIGTTYQATAGATSGLPVTLTIDPTSSSVCSINGGGLVTFNAAGTCIVNANQTGDADYNAAPQVQQNIIVNTQSSQTINFTSTAPTSPVISDTYQASATATSGLPVTLTIDASSSSVCSINGSGLVTFNATGTCLVDANQAGNGIYNPAPQVQQSMTVGKDSQTVIFTSAAPTSPIIGDTYQATAVATSGLPVTLTIDASSSNVCSINGGGLVTFNATGTCIVDANQAGDATYNAASQVQQSMTIGKTSQSINFTSTAPTSPVVGSTYQATATATSGLPVALTIDASSSSVCSINGSGLVTFNAAGTCLVDANQAGDANYNAATQIQQSMTVAKDSQTISFTSTAPVSPVVGDTYQTSATSTSGLTVALTIDVSSANVCSINGSGLVTFNTAGTCIVNANQSGNSTYATAPQIQQSITVSAGTASITVVPNTAVISIVGANIEQQFTASGGVAPYTFTADSLPAGLTLTSDGFLSGTILVPGYYVITIYAHDSRRSSTNNLKSGILTGSVTMKITVYETRNPANDPAVVGIQGGMLNAISQNTSQQTSNVYDRLLNDRECLDNSFDVNVAAPGFIDPNATNTIGSALKSVNTSKKHVCRDWGLWTNGNVNFGHYNRYDYTFLTPGITFGVDRLIAEKIILGAAIGYSNNEMNFSENNANSIGNSYNGMLYSGIKLYKHFLLDTILGYNYTRFNTNRTDALFLSQVAGTRNANTIFTSFRLSDELSLSMTKLLPYARYEFGSSSLASYTENGTYLDSLYYENTTFNYSLFTGGIRAILYPISVPKGFVEPFFNLEGSYNTSNNVNQKMAWAAVPSVIYDMNIQPLQKTSSSIGTGIRFFTKSALSCQLQYNFKYGQGNYAENSVGLLFSMPL